MAEQSVMEQDSHYVIHVQDKQKEFLCREDTSLLVGMGLVGAKYLPVGCRAGGCGICKIRVIKGEYEVKVMSRAHVSPDEEERGYALACRVFPRGDMLIEPFSKESVL